MRLSKNSMWPSAILASRLASSGWAGGGGIGSRWPCDGRGVASTLPLPLAVLPPCPLSAAFFLHPATRLAPMARPTIAPAPRIMREGYTRSSFAAGVGALVVDVVETCDQRLALGLFLHAHLVDPHLAARQRVR